METRTFSVQFQLKKKRLQVVEWFWRRGRRIERGKLKWKISYLQSKIEKDFPKEQKKNSAKSERLITAIYLKFYANKLLKIVVASEFPLNNVISLEEEKNW